MKIIICESEFDTEDGNHEGYSLAEIDIYAWIPWNKSKHSGIENHRLSMWKNLNTGEYELYRNYHGSSSCYDGDVIFKDPDMMVVLDEARREWDKWHAKEGGDHYQFEKCEHELAMKSISCRVCEA